MKPQLIRTHFETGRALEYFTEKELRQQIGYGVEYWGAAILRELIDNALDACESYNVAPVIEINIEDGFFSVADNGPGIPPQVIRRSLDYTVRVSDKAFYISPTRGQMGNALKVVYAAPFVMTQSGYIEITACGIKHRIEITVDRIAGAPKVNHEETELVRKGTFIKVYNEKLSGQLSNNKEADFYSAFNEYVIDPPKAASIIEGYTALNPHATFILNGKRYNAAVQTWRKWRPSMPTSAHWYNIETLADLVAGYLASQRDNGHVKTVREFIKEFAGLSSTIKQKEIGYSRADLSTFIRNEDIDRPALAELLAAMQAASIAPGPQVLGIIGREHVSSWLIRQGAAPLTIKYVKKIGIDDGMPYVIEVAYAQNKNNSADMQYIVGLNWSPVIGAIPDATMRGALQQARVDEQDPVIIFIHIARPRMAFSDRGKTRIELTPGARADLAAAIQSVTKVWKKLKRQADREDRVSERALQNAKTSASEKIKHIAFDVMEQAYNMASDGGTYYANARQIMYAARPLILERYDKQLSGNFSKYFTGTLLKDYIEYYNPAWKIVWDARGHFIEPHTGKVIGVGGYDVINYINAWHDNVSSTPPRVNKLIDTSGPGNRYNNILFIEKEGFTEILQAAGFQDRYDMALISTKGNPVKAACDLLAELKKHEGEKKIYVLHDFDYAGFKILRTLEEGVRLSRGVDVIELGLRIEDVRALPGEDVYYNAKTDPRLYLHKCGATADEINMLVSHKINSKSYRGKRVELNAMTSAHFIAWLDAKLIEYGAAKYMPSPDALTAGYQRAAFLQEFQRRIDEITVSEEFTPPEDLRRMIEDLMRDDPALSWDRALWQVVNDAKMKNGTV